MIDPDPTDDSESVDSRHAESNGYGSLSGKKSIVDFVIIAGLYLLALLSVIIPSITVYTARFEFNGPAGSLIMSEPVHGMMIAAAFVVVTAIFIASTIMLWKSLFIARIMALLSFASLMVVGVLMTPVQDLSGQNTQTLRCIESLTPNAAEDVLNRPSGIVDLISEDDKVFSVVRSENGIVSLFDDEGRHTTC